MNKLIHICGAWYNSYSSKTNYRNLNDKLRMTTFSLKPFRIPNVYEIQWQPDLTFLSWLVFLGLWISLCYAANLYQEQAWISSAIISTILLLRTADKNDTYIRSKGQSKN